MTAPNQLVAQLQRLDGHFGLHFTPDAAWIRCPKHKEGAERTPSLKINLDAAKAPLGTFYCFACPYQGTWDRLAKQLGLQQYGTIYEDQVAPLADTLEDELLPDESTNGVVTAITNSGLPWPPQQDWRKISGELVARLGGVHYFDAKAQQPCLFLPVKVNQQVVGGVRCLIEAERATNEVAKYRNTPGKWSKQALFPYDYIRELNPKVIVLVEGPRDALNLIQNQIPSLSNFGALNSWSADKIPLLLDLNPELILLGFDRDSAGKQATRTIRDELREWLSVKRLKLPRGQDPGDLSPRRLERLRRLLPSAD